MFKKLIFTTCVCFVSTCFADIKIENVYARAAKQGQNTAVYATLKNTSFEKDTLTKVSVKGCKKVELHETITEHKEGHEVSKMVEVKGGFDINSNETLVLEPGKNHIMLITLDSDLTEGSALEVTFSFKTHSDETVLATVKKPYDTKESCSCCHKKHSH